MPNLTNVITNTISISTFNRGLAGKIFEDVKKSGAKVVMKNNTAECVLISPEEYVRMMDEINDAHLLALAMERMSNFDESKLISQEELMKKYGISKEDVDNADEVDFE